VRKCLTDPEKQIFMANGLQETSSQAAGGLLKCHDLQT
jgi:hypothetical protein